MKPRATHLSARFLIKSFAYSMALACVLAGQANADIRLVSDLSGATEPNNTTFSADVSLSSLTNGNYELTIKLVNTTTSSAVGGYITGFAFSTPTGATYVSGSYQTTNSDFSLLTAPVSTQPFPSQDLGAALGGSWTGGGSPNDGIAWSAAGTNSATFTYDFSGTGLTEDMFKTALIGTSSDPGFLVRFRGLANGQSNKVPAAAALVPEPTSFALLGIGLTGALLGLRRRRSGNSPAL